VSAEDKPDVGRDAVERGPSCFGQRELSAIAHLVDLVANDELGGAAVVVDGRG
jgi:hypothetical protein